MNILVYPWRGLVKETVVILAYTQECLHCISARDFAFLPCLV